MSGPDRSDCRFLVIGPEGADEFPAEEVAIKAAQARPDSVVLCLRERGGYRTRQRVWPTVGRVFAENGPEPGPL